MTAFSLKFFEDFFETEYPYDKLDHTFAPKTTKKWNAMEYPGNILWSDFMIESNNSRKRHLKPFILFQVMAHMWIGNLVTIEWWDKAYIIEALADYLAYICYKAWYKGFNEKDSNGIMKYVHPSLVFGERKSSGMFLDNMEFSSKG